MIDVVAYKAQLESLAARLGVFDRINLHEPVSPPSTGITCAIWNQGAGPQPGESGLQSTTMRIVMMIRLFHVLRTENPDVIDDLMVGAASKIMGAISGDFDLGENIKNVDLLGKGGIPLSYEAGYAEEGEVTYRIITITVPLVVNDVFEQVR